VTGQVSGAVPGRTAEVHTAAMTIERVLDAPGP